MPRAHFGPVVNLIWRTVCVKFQRVPLAVPGPCESVGTASRPDSAEREQVRIFASSLRVKSLVEAQPRLGGKRTNDTYRVKLLSIVRAILESDPDDGISTDELMMVSGLSGEEVRKALHDLEDVGIANNDTVLTASVHRGVQRASELRFPRPPGRPGPLRPSRRICSPPPRRPSTAPTRSWASGPRWRSESTGRDCPPSGTPPECSATSPRPRA